MAAIRIAIVGLGKIARDQHIPAIAGTAGIELVAIASRNAAIDGIAHFATLDALLAAKPDIDAVALCTPPQVRSLQAAAALKAGKHVLLEKPPGATVSELTPLIAAARQTGRTLFATWHSRFAPGVEPAKASPTAVSDQSSSNGRKMSGSGIPVRPGSGSRAGSACSIPASTRSPSSPGFCLGRSF